MFNCKMTAMQISSKVRSVFAAILTVLLIASVALMLFGFAYSKSITLVDNGVSLKVTSSKIYLDEIIAENGLTLNTGDKIDAPLHSRVQNGDIYTITRAKKINLLLDGKVIEIYSSSSTLKEALADNGITLGEYDEVSPVLETEIENGMNAQIFRVKVENVVLQEPIPHIERKIPSADHSPSYRKVISQGKDGIVENEYKVITRDGKKISEELISSNIITEPVDGAVVIGTRNTKVVAASKEELSYSKVITCTATAYDPNPASCGGSGITATGRPACFGLVAVDPKVIPLGSKLYVESTDDGKSWTYGYAIAADTGGAIKGNRVDLCFNTRSECIQFGRRQAKIYILN